MHRKFKLVINYFIVNVLCLLYGHVLFGIVCTTFSVGIDRKELGGQLPKCLKFCPGIEI